MFRVFSIFNALFSRPRIRGAIQEWQNQLLAGVKKDIERLKDKFLSDASRDQNQSLSRVRDFPSISNKIQWMKQIERKLKEFMDRVQKVLGDKWEEHMEG